MVDHDDEALGRLRASDPATGSHPDLHRLRSLIAQKAPASQGAERATALDDDLMRGPRLRAPWIAAAAVAALALSGGGYAIGLQQGDGTTSPAARSVSPAAPGGAEVANGAALPGGMAAAEKMAADGGMSAGASGSSTAGPSFDPGPVRLTAGEGLPDSPGTAEVKVMRSDQDPQEFIDAYAAKSGFTGKPLPDSEYFAGPGVDAKGLIDTDKGRVITASKDGGALQFMYEDIYGSEYCSGMYAGMTDDDLQAMKDEWAKGYGPDLPFPSPDQCREVTGERPSDDAAEAAAKDFFAQAGVDVSKYTFKALSSDSYPMEVFSSELSVDSMAVTGGPGSGGSSAFVNVEATLTDSGIDSFGMGGPGISATVGPEGLVSAYGSVGELSSLGEYPVISAKEAVARYASREFATDYSVSIADDMAMYDDMAAATGMAVAMPQPASLEPGDKLPLLRKDKTVTGAELVRGTLWTQSAGSAEVPVWKLTTADGMYYTVLALSEEAVDFQSWD